jgi:hypothetical protein
MKVIHVRAVVPAGRTCVPALSEGCDFLRRELGPAHGMCELYGETTVHRSGRYYKCPGCVMACAKARREGRGGRREDDRKRQRAKRRVRREE